MNKKISLLLIVVMFAVAMPIVSASVEYVEENDTYIVDSIWPSWLGGNGESIVKLIENTDYCLIDCEATIEFNNEEEVVLTEEIQFLDRQGRDVTNGLRDLKFLLGKYQDVEYGRPIYEEVCEEKVANSTNQNEIACYNKKVGEENYYINELVWTEYDGSKQSGLSYLKIKAKKSPLKSIDWIITFRGEDLVEWEWWDTDWSFKRSITVLDGTISALYNITYDANMKTDFSDLRFIDFATETIELNYTIVSKIDSVSARIRVNNLDVSEIYMYYGNATVSTTENASNVYFDPISGYFFDNANANDFNNINNGTITGATFTSSGYIGGAYDFNGAGANYMIFPAGTAPIGSSDRTINFWINPDSINLNDGIFGYGATTGSEGFFGFNTNPTPTLRFFSIPSDIVTNYSIQTGVWQMVTVTYDGTTVKVYANANLVGSQAISINTAATFNLEIGDVPHNHAENFDGDIDELYVYNRALSQSELIQLRDQTQPSFIVGAEEELRGVSTILITPQQGSNFTNPFINFSFSSVPNAVNLTNATLYLWNETDSSLILTNFTTLSGSETINTTFFNNLTQGNYKWNVESCAEDVACSFAPSNLSFIVHTTPPSIAILNPVGTTDYFLLGDNETLTWRVEEPGTNLSEHIVGCSYSYNNITVDVTSICLTTNTTEFEYVLGVNELEFTVIDVFNFITTNTTTWEYDVIELNQTFNNETTEGAMESFETKINLQTGLSIVATAVIYNGTTSVGSSSTSGEITTLNVESLQIPTVLATTNLSFFWTVVLSDSSIINLSTQNQTVFNLALDDCSSFSNVIFNLTSKDEETQVQLSTTSKEIAVNAFSSDREIEAFNLSGEFTDNPTGICLNRNLTAGTTYSLDVIIRYQAPGYANEFYNIVNFNLSNDTVEQKINLFNINLSDATEFQLTFKGTDFLPVEDALVLVERQYIAENAFKTVELPKTDSNGQTVLHLVRNDIIYNIIVMKDGEVLGRFTNLIAFCDDFSIGDCKIVLNAIGEEETKFDLNEQIGILFDTSPVYNDTTKIVSFSFASVDGTAKTILMDVERRDIFGNTSVCSNVLVSTSGTLSCNVENISDTQLITSIKVDGEEWIISPVQIDSEGYGNMGTSVAFIFTLVLVLSFGDTKNGAMISIGLGYIIAVSMGFIIGGISGVGTAGIWIIVLTVLGLYQINK